MKMSRRAQRMARQHVRHRPASLHMVSLMDIFTILLFFLLIHAGEPAAFDLPERVQLPDSVAETPTQHTPVLHITPQEVSLLEGPSFRLEDDTQAGPLPGLQSHLMQLSAADSKRQITLMGDREVPYRRLKRVLETCAAAGFSDIELAVEYKEPEA